MPYKDILEQKSFQRNYKKNKVLAIAALKNTPCLDCRGIFPPECMQFDHRPGTEKKGNISKLVNYRWSIILDEISKCDLICANCHAIRTTRLARQ